MQCCSSLLWMHDKQRMNSNYVRKKEKSKRSRHESPFLSLRMLQRQLIHLLIYSHSLWLLIHEESLQLRNINSKDSTEDMLSASFYTSPIRCKLRGYNGLFPKHSMFFSCYSIVHAHLRASNSEVERIEGSTLAHSFPSFLLQTLSCNCDSVLEHWQWQ